MLKKLIKRIIRKWHEQLRKKLSCKYWLLDADGIHIMGVLVPASLVHRENLIKAMITGRKQAI